VRVAEDAMEGQRLVWGRHALRIQHDDVLDQTENPVATFVCLHDRHQVLDFIKDGLEELTNYLLKIVPLLLRKKLICQLTEKSLCQRCGYTRSLRGSRAFRRFKKLLVVSLLHHECLGSFETVNARFGRNRKFF